MSRAVEFERARNAYMLAMERFVNAIEWELYAGRGMCEDAAWKVRAVAEAYLYGCRVRLLAARVAA